MKRLVAIVVLATALVGLWASPAAAEAGTRHWFYWSAPLLTLGTVALLAALGIGYYVKVLRPKYRGR
jgi:hypothetical protein